MGSLMVAYGFLMASLWLSIWLPHGFPMASLWYPYNVSVVVLWLCYGCPVGFLWSPVSLWFPDGFPWLSNNFPMASPWFPYVGSLWLPSGFPMGFLWLASGFPTGFSIYSHCFSSVSVSLCFVHKVSYFSSRLPHGFPMAFPIPCVFLRFPPLPQLEMDLPQLACPARPRCINHHIFKNFQIFKYIM